jgi:hypothetical protein
MITLILLSVGLGIVVEVLTHSFGFACLVGATAASWAVSNYVIKRHR